MRYAAVLVQQCQWLFLIWCRWLFLAALSCCLSLIVSFTRSVSLCFFLSKRWWCSVSLSLIVSLAKMIMQCSSLYLSVDLFFLNLDISLSLYLQNSKLEDFLNLSFFEISTTDTRLQRLQRCSMLATDKCAFSSLPVASDGQGLEFRRHRSCMLLASQPCTAHCQRLVLAQYLERISSWHRCPKLSTDERSPIAEERMHRCQKLSTHERSLLMFYVVLFDELEMRQNAAEALSMCQRLMHGEVLRWW